MLFGDLGPTGITKRHAIEVLLDYLHADAKDTISLVMLKLTYRCLNVALIMLRWVMVALKLKKPLIILLMM